MPNHMTWWMWIIAGFVCLASEMLTPGLLYLAFLGVSALFVGALAWLVPGLELWIEVLFFSVVMVALGLAMCAWVHRSEQIEPWRPPL